MSNLLSCECLDIGFRSHIGKLDPYILNTGVHFRREGRVFLVVFCS